MIMTKLTPAIFFGHGNPMNAIGQNAYTDGWSRDRTDHASAEGHPVHLRALVRAGDRRHDSHRAAHDPRFRRVSARALSRSNIRLPATPRSRAGSNSFSRLST